MKDAKVGDFIMYYHNYTLITGVREKFYDVYSIYWDENYSRLIFHNTTLLKTLFDKIIPTHGGELNTIYSEIIKDLIKKIFEYARS